MHILLMEVLDGAVYNKDEILNKNVFIKKLREGFMTKSVA